MSTSFNQPIYLPTYVPPQATTTSILLFFFDRCPTDTSSVDSISTRGPSSWTGQSVSYLVSPTCLPTVLLSYQLFPSCLHISLSRLALHQSISQPRNDITSLTRTTSFCPCVIDYKPKSTGYKVDLRKRNAKSYCLSRLGRKKRKKEMLEKMPRKQVHWPAW